MRSWSFLVALISVCGCNTCLNSGSVPFVGPGEDMLPTLDAAADMSSSADQASGDAFEPDIDVLPDLGGCEAGSEPALDGCIDVDECARGTHDCDPLVECVNTSPFFDCGPCPDMYVDQNGDGTLCVLPDAALVRSVTQFVIPLPDQIARATIPEGVNAANAVPFATVAINHSVATSMSAALVDVWVDTGSREIVVERGSGDGTAQVTVQLVEFDAATVQSGTFGISGASSTETLAQAVDTSRTFVAYSAKAQGVGGRDAAFSTGEFDGTDQLRFTRLAADGVVDGHFYVVTANNDEFSVQHRLMTILPRNTCETAEIAAVVESRSFTLFSNRMNAGGPTDPTETHIYCDLDQPDEVTCCRGRSSSRDDLGLTVPLQVVTFAEGLAGTVQRGRTTHLGYSVETTPLPVPVDADWATSQTGATGVLGQTFLEFIVPDADEGAAFSTITLSADGTELEFERLEPAPYDTEVWWQVVSWPH